MPAYPRSVVLPALLALLSPTAEAMAREKQVVLISFDGAHDIRQWRRSRALAERTGARFTYFLSCVFLLSPDTKRLYDAPRHGAGRSNVGFAPSRGDVAARLGEIWSARAEGHEIASHGCGHFDGKDFSKADWLSEFSQFTTFLRDAWEINGLFGEPPGWRAFAMTEVKGFRAPYLSVGPGLAPALAEAGYAYDASGIARTPEAPTQGEALVEFALPMIPEGPAGRRVIAMDYNIFVRHSGGFERGDEAGAFEDRAYQAFRNAFDAQYAGQRTPLQIGLHFTLMNGGAYWRALERFAEEVCGKTDVVCTTYADYVATLGAVPAERQVAPVEAGAPMGG